MCSKCLEKAESFTKIHSCLHHSICVVPEPPDAPNPRSVVWEPSKCPTCMKWVDHLKRSTLSSLERDCFRSFLQAIFSRRRRSGVHKERQWFFFPSLELQETTSPIWSPAGKSKGRPISRSPSASSLNRSSVPSPTPIPGTDLSRGAPY